MYTAVLKDIYRDWYTTVLSRLLMRAQNARRKTKAMDQERKAFVDRHFGTIVMIVALFVAQISIYAVLQSRVVSLEEHSHDYITQGEHKDLQRRTEMLEAQIVPRSEHIAMDVAMNKRLDEIALGIRELQARIDRLDRLDETKR